MDNGQQQQDTDYQRWLADPEAQAEYERWLNSLDRELAQKVQRQLDDFDWLGMEGRN